MSSSLLEYKQLNTSTFDAVLNADFNIFSIDVFDTAITRRLEAPVDVFALAEQTLVAAHGRAWKGFAVAREDAEIEARRRAAERGRHEVTLHDIYTAFAEAKPALAKGVTIARQAEIDAETAVIVPVPDMVLFVEKARAAGRRVVFVSDMYLGRSEIGGLLTHCGYDFAEGLLVSSETGKTKAAGTQWQVLRDLVGKDARILHIGDDPWSDVASPERHGIPGLLFGRARSERRIGGPLTPDILPFSRLSRAVTLARLQGDQRAQADDPAAFMRDFGASWGAVVVGSFVRWLEERVTRHRLDHLAFCARDGYLVKQAWEASGAAARTGIPFSYLYVSRRTLNLADAALSGPDGKLTDMALDRLASGRLPLGTLLDRSNLGSCRALVRDAIAAFGELNTVVERGEQNRNFRNLLVKHQQAVIDALTPSAEATLQYLFQELPSTGRVGLVDIGWQGTLQYSLARLLRKSDTAPMLFGFYYGLWPAAQRRRPIAGWMEGAFGNDFYSFEEQFGMFNAVAILENLHLAHHGTTVGYRLQEDRWIPVLQESEIERRQHSALITSFQSATLAAVNEIYSDRNSVLEKTELKSGSGLAAISRVSVSPSSGEMLALGQIEHAIEFDHSHFRTLLHSEWKADPPWPLATDWPVANGLVLRKAKNHTDLPADKEAITTRIRTILDRLDSRSTRQFV
jgi:predicted HAD superfamily hydrolase